MAYLISSGMPVKVGVGTEDREITIPITTMNPQGRFYEREKTLKSGQFLFGTVRGVHEVQQEVRKPVLDGKGKPVVDKESGGPVTKVVQPAKYAALIMWAGPKCRTSILPVGMLIPAVAVETVEITPNSKE